MTTQPPVFTTKLAPYTISYTQGEEFHRLKQEIFSHHSYYIEIETPVRRIIDAGAHIGLATLYFARQFPEAQITALEPHPQSFALLTQNITQNGLDVRLVPAALTPVPGPVALFQDSTDTRWWSTTSIHPQAWNCQQTTAEFTVSGVSLAELLTEPVDLLKLDIEGAEESVLLAAGSALHQVAHLILEFHPHPSQSQERLESFLRSQGFQVTSTAPPSTHTARPDRSLRFIEAHRR